MKKFTKDFNYKVNQEIQADEVLLIDKEGEKVGKTSLKEALALAERDNLDLIQMNSLEVPVARIVDHGKFIYNKTVKQKKQKNKRTSTLKEIKLYAKIAEADYQVKLKNIINFLEKENKVKIVVFLKGREKRNPGLALEFLFKIMEDLPDVSPVSPLPTRKSPMPVHITVIKKKT